MILLLFFFGLIEIIWNLFFQKKYSAIRNLLKGFRLLQLIRLHRIIRLFDGLQLLTQALMKTVLTYTFSVVILVFLFIYIVAVIGQILYGRSEDSLWHHFSTSLSIATRLTLVDNWNLIEPELENHGSPPISRWFLIIIVFVGNRIVTNVLVGLMIESVSSVNDDYIKEKREKKNLRNQKKREELSKRTTQIFNTRASDTNSKTNRIEHIKSKLNWFHNEIISPKEFIFLIGWLEKLVACSEKSQIEIKSIHRLIIHNIQSLSNVINENLKKNEKLDDKYFHEHHASTLSIASTMVKLHVKHGDESQFLFEIAANTPIDILITQISLIYNGRLKVHRICGEVSMLAKHGITLPVNMQGLTEDQITDLKLVDEYADKCIPMDGYVEEEDGTGRRNGRAPTEKMRSILERTIQEAKDKISKKLVQADQCVTCDQINEALQQLKGA
ncbi:unnamed protein product, partial [Rotaria magnacalcarata]